tara:strand:- start:1887 stop:2051 length:165 start_codon:yes stop_codon:yes gene_type:complete
MKKAKRPQTIQKSVRLNVRVVEGIKTLATQENRTFNNMLETLLIVASEQRQRTL